MNRAVKRFRNDKAFTVFFDGIHEMSKLTLVPSMAIIMREYLERFLEEETTKAAKIGYGLGYKEGFEEATKEDVCMTCGMEDCICGRND